MGLGTSSWRSQIYRGGLSYNASVCIYICERVCLRRRAKALRMFCMRGSADGAQRLPVGKGVIVIK